MRLLIAGDTHGNLPFWADTLLPNAVRNKADAVVQVGDFGFWTHQPAGVQYLDDLDALCAEAGVSIYALHGNHDNWSKIMADHGDRRDEDWFVVVREFIHYIPQGHIWTWAGVRMRAFGGAYSIDKEWRLRLEAKRYRSAMAREHGRREAGHAPSVVEPTAGTLWFPDEEMSTEEFLKCLDIDCRPVDVVFTHDKPRDSNPGINLKDIPECHRNQNNLQIAMAVLRPRWWFHGHLHHAYVDTVACGYEDATTTVVGLSCDDQAAMAFWRPSHAWCLLDLPEDGRTPPTMITPEEAARSTGRSPA